MTSLIESSSPLIEVRSPADGRLVGSVTNHGRAEVRAAAAELRSAQPAWEDLGPNGRRAVLLRWADWILDNDRRLGELAQAESGKAWGDAAFESTAVVEIVNYYAKNAAEFLSPRRVKPSGPAGATKRLAVRFRPLPLVGVITPWNSPLGNPVLDAIGALMAGAAVLCKPSEVTPMSWTEAVRGFRQDVGGPPILASITGDGATGEAVVDEVDMVMFTGSTRTGRKIAARCGERLIPCSLELGGKDAMIVLSDADIDRAVAGATWGAMMNSGQACVSVERAYVEAPVYDEFLEKVTVAVSNLRMGTDAPGDFSCEVGAMATLEQVNIVERHVKDAIGRGARVLTGGQRGQSGSYFEPTVLADVDHSMACMHEETFGPTLPVMKVRDEEEAVRLANDSTYGLSASVWSRDPDRADRVSRRLEVGAVNINNVMVNLFQFGLPQGGWKDSGVGARFGGPNGVLKFCRQQACVSERIILGSEPYWFPYSARKGRLLARGARLLGANDWRRRLGLRPR